MGVCVCIRHAVPDMYETVTRTIVGPWRLSPIISRERESLWRLRTHFVVVNVSSIRALSRSP